MFYLFLRDRLQSKLFFLFTVETEKSFLNFQPSLETITVTTLVNCAKEMRKCEISRLGGAKDGGKEMPRSRGAGWGGLLFSL